MAEGAVRPRKSITVFRFTPYKPGAGKLDQGIAEFEAHITAIRDTNTPSWNSSNDMGRADPKVFYSAYHRSIGINFIVVSLTKQEHIDNFINLRKLVGLTYPIYNGSKRGYNAPHVLVEVGALLSVIGNVTSIDYSWDAETPWIDEKPILTEVSIDINVLTNGAGERPEYKDSEYKHFT